MTKDVGQQGSGAETLRRLFPYLRMWRGKVFVVKAGGAAIRDLASARRLLEQVGTLQQLGIRVVVVHGGGPQATELAQALGLPVSIVDGRRVTDERSLEVTTMVLSGLVNSRLLAAGRSLGLAAVGVSGVDSGLIQATRRPPVRSSDGTLVDYGFVGDIQAVDVQLLTTLLDSGAVPVVSPISADDQGTLLNVNADSVAAALAVALRAEKLVLVTEAAGLLERLDDAHSLISYIDMQGLERLRASGALSGGMLPKVTAIQKALAGGVPRAHIVSSELPDSLLVEVFTNEGSGTMVVGELATLEPAEQVAVLGVD
jgi:acetylglutamate kinase